MIAGIIAWTAMTDVQRCITSPFSVHLASTASMLGNRGSGLERLNKCGIVWGCLGFAIDDILLSLGSH